MCLNPRLTGRVGRGCMHTTGRGMGDLSGIDWGPIARYLAGESSPAEGAAIQRSLAGDPARAQLVARLRVEWERAGAVPPESELPAPVDVARGGTALAGEVGLEERAGPRPPRGCA